MIDIVLGSGKLLFWMVAMSLKGDTSICSFSAILSNEVSHNINQGSGSRLDISVFVSYEKWKVYWYPYDHIGLTLLGIINVILKPYVTCNESSWM